MGVVVSQLEIAGGVRLHGISVTGKGIRRRGGGFKTSGSQLLVVEYFRLIVGSKQVLATVGKW